MERTWVVGDVHGCYDELMDLLTLIKKSCPPGDLNSFCLKERDRLVFLGDYIDRGPNSKEVLEFLMNLEAYFGADRVVCLLGNHESMLLYYDFTFARATVESFDGTIPGEYWDWLSKLRSHYDGGTFFAVHAGAMPGVEMREQSEMYLLWHRYHAGDPACLSKHLYHGHTPQAPGTDAAVDRTNLDGGCVFGGKLLAALVGPDGKPERLLSVDSRADYTR